MESSEIKMGDIVKLKSGGPYMTVVFRPIDGSARCSWFVAGEVREWIFPLSSLTKMQKKITSNS